MAENVSNPEEEKSSSGWTMTRVMVLAIAVLFGIILLTFIIGLILAAAVPDTFGNIIRVLRDMLFIAMILEGILIGAAFVILVMQVARLVNALQTQTRPILENAEEATSIAKGTAQFASKNAMWPLVRILSFLSGLRVFLREFGGIRRAIRRSPKANGDDKHDAS